MDRRAFVKTIVLGAGGLLFGARHLLAAGLDENATRIVMIYNNTSRSKDFVCEWGLSAWVENRDGAVLFDTGQSPDFFRRNADKLGIDLRKAANVIISHNHGDHYGGLGHVLDKTGHAPEVFVPGEDANAFRRRHPKARITGVTDPVQITSTIGTTGTMDGFLQEQSLIITHDGAMVILTGCAHPGVVTVVERAKAIHPGKRIDLVAGGFHVYSYAPDVVRDISDRLKQLGVRRLAPSHCTGSPQIEVFKEEWQEGFVDFGAGDDIAV